MQVQLKGQIYATDRIVRRFTVLAILVLGIFVGFYFSYEIKESDLLKQFSLHRFF